jgi:hypothetical protein
VAILPQPRAPCEPPPFPLHLISLPRPVQPLILLSMPLHSIFSSTPRNKQRGGKPHRRCPCITVTGPSPAASRRVEHTSSTASSSQSSSTKKIEPGASQIDAMVIFLPAVRSASSTILSPSVPSALAGSSYSITARIRPSKTSSGSSSLSSSFPRR